MRDEAGRQYRMALHPLHAGCRASGQTTVSTQLGRRCHAKPSHPDYHRTASTPSWCTPVTNSGIPKVAQRWSGRHLLSNLNECRESHPVPTSLARGSPNLFSQTPPHPGTSNGPSVSSGDILHALFASQLQLENESVRRLAETSTTTQRALPQLEIEIRP